MKKVHKQLLIFFLGFFTACGTTLAISSLTSRPDDTSISHIEVTAKPLAAPTTITPVSVNTTASSTSLTCEFTVVNSWEEHGKTLSQLTGKLTNISSNTLSDWEVQLAVPKGTTISQSWNGSYAIMQDYLKVTPAQYNKEIAAYTSVEIGCILSSSSNIDVSKVTCSVDHQTVSSTAPTSPSSTLMTPLPSASPLDKVALTEAEKVSIAKTGDWLYTKGNKIFDKNGNEVWLTGLNWFGYNTGTNTFDGLWNANLDQCLKSIADHGFNLLRIPISAELINNWAKGTYPTANFNQAKNSHLVGKNSQQIFDYMLALCKTNGIKVMLDIHSAETDASGHNVNVWYTHKITEKDYLSALSYMAKRYATDDTIIAFDLKNEPHGKPNESPRAIWNNSTSPNNWKYIAEQAAKTVLKQNPNVLIMVEGTEIYPKDIKANSDYHSTNSGDYYSTWWGGNLRGVKDYPINLGQYQNKLVYSPHDYGPTVYQQPWFKNGYNYDSLYKDCWKDNWFYIYENKTAPLLIGEWGGYMTEPNLSWMTYMRQLIQKFKLHHTFWCYNANSGDTGGLVLDDFTTWDEQKYNFVKEVLWQKDGKFVGLDQETPLGSNGISLQQYNKK